MSRDPDLAAARDLLARLTEQSTRSQQLFFGMLATALASASPIFPGVAGNHNQFPEQQHALTPDNLLYALSVADRLPAEELNKLSIAGGMVLMNSVFVTSVVRWLAGLLAAAKLRPERASAADKLALGRAALRIKATDPKASFASVAGNIGGPQTANKVRHAVEAWCKRSGERNLFAKGGRARN